MTFRSKLSDALHWLANAIEPTISQETSEELVEYISQSVETEVERRLSCFRWNWNFRVLGLA